MKTSKCVRQWKMLYCTSPGKVRQFGGSIIQQKTQNCRCRHDGSQKFTFPIETQIKFTRPPTIVSISYRLSAGIYLAFENIDQLQSKRVTIFIPCPFFYFGCSGADPDSFSSLQRGIVVCFFLISNKNW